MQRQRDLCSTLVRTPKRLVGTVLYAPGGAQYRLERLLQAAIYGAVYQADELGTKGLRRRVAVKVMAPALRTARRGLLEALDAEEKFKPLMQGHPNVLVHDLHWEANAGRFVVMPFAELEDLFEVLSRRRKGFTEEEARWLFIQLLDALRYLHGRGLALRDLSLENVLLFVESGTGLLIPKITDPGQAVAFHREKSGAPQKLPNGKLYGKSFRAPELYEKGAYDPEKLDLFALGWMLFYATTKSPLFDEATANDVQWRQLQSGRMDSVMNGRGGAHLSAPLRRLLAVLLSPLPHHRPTAAQALTAEWFRGPQKCLTLQTVFDTPKIHHHHPHQPAQQQLPHIVQPAVHKDGQTLQVIPIQTPPQLSHRSTYLAPIHVTPEPMSLQVVASPRNKYHPHSSPTTGRPTMAPATSNNASALGSAVIMPLRQPLSARPAVLSKPPPLTTGALLSPRLSPQLPIGAARELPWMFRKSASPRRTLLGGGDEPPPLKPLSIPISRASIAGTHLCNGDRMALRRDVLQSPLVSPPRLHYPAHDLQEGVFGASPRFQGELDTSQMQKLSRPLRGHGKSIQRLHEIPAVAAS